jgi:hypothetical protein
MATRCFYYIDDNSIVEQWINISWNKGFTKDAKHSYIHEAEEIALDSYGRIIVDVTTASPLWQSRSLSPYFVKYSDNVSVEDAWPLIKQQLKGFIPGAFDYIYLHSLQEGDFEYVKSCDGFIDIFHNPEKKTNTQAKALAVLQLLNKQNKIEILCDSEKFLDWYSEINFDIRRE